MRSLLDVNVLVALLDHDHVGHEAARHWFADHVNDGWASCAITQNGYVRIVTQPAYGKPTTIPDAVSRLRYATATKLHEFWSCATSIVDGEVDVARVHGPAQITDAYLLALAVAQQGRFVTFDRRIALAAVPAARLDNLVVIGQ